MTEPRRGGAKNVFFVIFAHFARLQRLCVALRTGNFVGCIMSLSTQTPNTAEARPGLARICPHDSSCGQIKKGLALRTQFLDTLKVIILASAVVLSVQYVFAWSGPPGNPPPDPCPTGQPGCDPPVNVGNSPQGKSAGFSATSLGATVLNIDATDNGVGNYDISIVGGSSGGITVGNDGGIIATNSAVRGASIENLSGSARIDSTGTVRGVSGIFSGGVTVGTGAGDSYLRIDSTDTAPNGSCTDSDIGKMILHRTQNRVYVCRGDENWGYVDVLGVGGSGL